MLCFARAIALAGLSDYKNDVAMPLNLFGGIRPVEPKRALRDLLAGVNLASINIPQVLGLFTHRRHDRGLRTLHLAAAAGRVRDIRLVAPSGRGRRLGHRRHLFRFAVPPRRAGQRAIHDAGQHGGAADRRVAAAWRESSSWAFSPIFSRARCWSGFLAGCRVPGRHCDAERHVRRRRPIALLAGSGLADHATACRTCIVRRWRCPRWSRRTPSCSATDSRRGCRSSLIAVVSAPSRRAPTISLRGAGHRARRPDRRRLADVPPAQGDLERDSRAAARIRAPAS